jgi:hypothetical protein
MVSRHFRGLRSTIAAAFGAIGLSACGLSGYGVTQEGLESTFDGVPGVVAVDAGNHANFGEGPRWEVTVDVAYDASQADLANVFDVIGARIRHAETTVRIGGRSENGSANGVSIAFDESGRFGDVDSATLAAATLEGVDTGEISSIQMYGDTASGRPEIFIDYRFRSTQYYWNPEDWRGELDLQRKGVALIAALQALIPEASVQLNAPGLTIWGHVGATTDEEIALFLAIADKFPISSGTIGPGRVEIEVYEAADVEAAQALAVQQPRYSSIEAVTFTAQS